MPEMRLRDPAWLLRGLSSLPGELALAGGRLSFTAADSGSLGSGALAKLETETGAPDLARRLRAGERTVLFDVPLPEVREIRFPWYWFSGGVKLTVGGTRHRIAFARPNGAPPPVGEGQDSGGLVAARRRGRTWKAALAGRTDSAR